MDHVTAEILGVDTGKPPYSDDKQQMEWESEVFRTIEAMIGK